MTNVVPMSPVLIVNQKIFISLQLRIRMILHIEKINFQQIFCEDSGSNHGYLSGNLDCSYNQSTTGQPSPSAKVQRGHCSSTLPFKIVGPISFEIIPLAGKGHKRVGFRATTASVGKRLYFHVL